MAKLLIHHGVIAENLISDLQSSDIDKRIHAFCRLEELGQQTASFIVQKADGICPGLEEFGKDLIQSAKDGEFNLVSVEDEVIERALLIMKRRRKRSPLILDADSNVRKSTVEAIVRRIASGAVPSNLKNRRILLLDLDKLLAIQDRTEREKQFRAVFKDMVGDDAPIIYIDGIERILTRCTESTYDAIEAMFRTVFRLWGKQVIGGTTWNTYRACIGNDAALDRSFAVLIPAVDARQRLYKAELKLFSQVAAFVKQYKLDHTTIEARGYVALGERYAPNFAFISFARQPELAGEGYNPNPPDLAIEVEFPTSTQSERQLRIKLANYLAVGTVVWVIYPETKEVEVYLPGRPVKILGINETLDGGEVLPGFQMPVRDIFAE